MDLSTLTSNATPRTGLRLRLRVVHKLFALLALAIALALGALGSVTVLNLRSGFVDYVNALDLARLAPLAQELDQRADATQGFDGLRDRATWDALLHRLLDPKPPHGAPDPVAKHPPPPLPPPPSVHDDHGRANDAPPPPALSPRVSLLDAKHQWIVGAPLRPNALQRPLQQNGTRVGWLALQPLTHPVDSRDTDFLAAQIRDMAMLAGLLLLLALGVAWVFARHLLAPLRDVEQSADRLASGKYGLHLETSRRDELGDLVRHINRLSSALQANESARRRWVADISHELRTPLSIVRGELEAMQDGLRVADADGLRSLHEEVMRLDRLVDDLHQLSMADLGTLSYRPQLLDIAELIGIACSSLEPIARQAQLTIACDLSPVQVRADADRLRQLIDNVIGNALRYSDAGGRVQISMVRHAQSVDVIVDDTPPGVDADSLARLFEPMYRGEASRDRKRGGSGLGLAIAQRIAVAHDGTLHAMASPLGGLRIVLTLPSVQR
jgi:two-component system sensor histidine kinase BaeS